MPYPKAVAVDARSAITPSELEKKLALKQENVRRRAYEIYCQRRDSDALSDWLQAELDTELLTCTGIEERNGTFHLEAGLTGYKANQLNVTVLPRAVVVESRDITGLLYSRLTMLELPSPIRAETVTAWLNRGVLAITVEKLVEHCPAESGEPTLIAAQAA